MANEVARRLRREATAGERRLWFFLRELKREGFRFRRQVPIDRYVVDFACLSQRLIVEVDGSQHFEPNDLAKDSERDAHLRWRGFSVVRFSNADVMHNIPGVMDRILLEIGMVHDKANPNLFKDRDA